MNKIYEFWRTTISPTKVWLLVCAVIVFSQNLKAQVSNYSFSQNTGGTYTPITTGTGATPMVLLGTATSAWDSQIFHNNVNGAGGPVTEAGFPIGFNFTYNGTIYDKFVIGTDGWIKLGTGATFTSGGAGSAPISTTTANTDNIIAALGVDLSGGLRGIGTRTSGSPTYTLTGTGTSVASLVTVGMRIVGTGIPAGTTVTAIAGNTITMSANATSSSTSAITAFVSGNEIMYQTIGTAPNRELVVQWSGVSRLSGYGDNLNFQIRLTETSNVVSVTYGTCTMTSTVTTANTAQVGLKGLLTPAIDYNNRTGTGTTAWTTTTAGTASTSTLPLQGAAATGGLINPSSGLTFIWTPPPPCNGTPTAGTASVNNASLCYGGTANFSLTGATAGPGITYQWQLSPDGIAPYADIVGATTVSFSATNVTTNGFYRCVVTCANPTPTPSISNVVQITVSSPITTLPYLENFNSTTVGQTPTCWNRILVSGTDNWLIGTTTQATEITSNFDGNFAYKLWGNSEVLFISPAFNFASAGASSVSFDFQMHRRSPAGATDRIEFYVNTQPNLTGAVLLQNYPSLTTGTSVATANAGAVSAVAGNGWYNYQMNIPSSLNAQPAVYIIARGVTASGFSSYAIAFDNFRITLPCSGTPTAGTATTSSSSVLCTNATVNLNITGSTLASGITYQWQFATAVGGPYTNITGATTPAYTASVTTNGFFRCVVTCTNSTQSVETNAVEVTVTNAPTYATIPLTESFESTWNTTCVVAPLGQDIPNASWRTIPASGNTSWRADNTTTTLSGWTSTSGSYTPASSNGSRSARFHSFNAGSGTQGSLDLYVNLSNAGTKQLGFDFINTSGTDVLQLFLSEDGGQTFNPITTTPASLGVAASWTSVTATLTSTSATAVIRFRATSDFGATDIGLDNVQVVLLQPTDISAMSINLPNTCYSATAPVNFVIRNTGTSPLDFTANNAVATVNVTGQITQTLTLNINDNSLNGGNPLAPNTNLVLNMGTINMSVAGTYNFTGSINTTGDLAASNNTMATPFVSTLVAPLPMPYVENFNGSTALPAGYVQNVSFWETNASAATGGVGSTNGLRTNMYDSGSSRTPRITLPIIGQVAAGATLSFAYRFVNFSAPNAGTAFGANDFVKVQVSTDCGATFSDLVTYNQANHTPTNTFQTANISLTPYVGQNITLRIDGFLQVGSLVDTYLIFDDISIVAPCSGMPNAGTPNITSQAVCAVTNLVVTGVSVGPGISYQWEISTTSSTTGYTDVVGANASIYAAPLPTQTTWYRLKITCANGSQTNTSPAIQLAPFPASITTYPYNENFDGVTGLGSTPIPTPTNNPTNVNMPCGWSVENVNADNRTWFSSATADANSAPNALVYSWNSASAANDWAFAPAFTMTAGKIYKVTFKYRASSASFPERIEVRWGTAANATSMLTTNSIFENLNVNNTTYTDAVCTDIIPTTTGIYYVGIYAKSLTNQFNLLVDDFQVVETCPTVTINPITLPNGVGGATYSQTPTQTGFNVANGTISWSVSAGALPTGLTLNTTTGEISGTPTATGTFNFTLQVAQGTCNSTRVYTVDITCPTTYVFNPVTGSNLPNAITGVAYTTTIGQTTLPAGQFTWSATGLPAGLTIDANTGVISGTSNATAQTYNVTVTITGTGGLSTCSGSATYNLVLAACNVTINPATLPNGTVGSAYNQTITQTGLAGPVTWSVSTGTLPAGLTLNATTGEITGTPTNAGTSNFEISVTDGTCNVPKAYSIVVACPTLTFNNTTANVGIVGANYSLNAGVSGNTQAVTYTVTPALPAGLTLDANTGSISGVPTTATASATYTVTATQGTCSVTQNYTFAVNCPNITISPAVLPTPGPGLAYSQVLTITGNIQPVTVSVTGLPAGFTFDAATNTISGTTTQLVSTNVVVTVTQGTCVVSTTTTWNIICPSATIAPNVSNLPIGTQAALYPAVTFTQTGLQGTPTWNLSAGTLPTGLTLSTGGVLSGTPTQSGNFNIVVRASSGTCEVIRTYALSINSNCPVVLLNPAQLPNGNVNSVYPTTNIVPVAGVAPFTFAVSSGTMPAGLSMNATGQISGTPTAVGTSNVNITVTDANGCVGSATYIIVINAACSTITLNPATLPTGTVNVFYNQILSATGGTAPYTYSIATGTLPAGLSLSNSGNIAGTSTTTGTFSFAVRVIDAIGCSAIANYSITINPIPTRVIAVNPTTLTFPNTLLGQTATLTFTIQNTGNSAMSVTGINYPTGFSGVFTGSIPAGGSQVVTVTFAPTVVGTFSGTILVNSNATSGANTITVTGEGVNSLPTALVDFGKPIVTVYPNPSANDFNVKFDNNWRAEYDVKVMDLNGKVVFETKTDEVDEIQLRLGHLANGTYILHLETKRGKTALRIVRR